MGTVTIGSTSYTIYGTRAAADEYWAAMLGQAATAWEDADDADADKALVSATRLLDRQSYVEEAETFALRDAIENADGLEVFQVACYELAGALLVDPTLLSTPTSGKNIKRVSAVEGTEVEFFAPTLGITGRFPTQVQELIGDYLAGAEIGSVSGSFSSGTDQETSFPGGDYDISRAH